MKRTKLLPLLGLSALLLGLTACGGETEPTPPPSMTAEELAGVWTDGLQNFLLLDPDNSRYLYLTYYGRLGSGDMDLEDRPMLSYDDFLYDFLSRFYPENRQKLEYFCAFIVSGNLNLALTWLNEGAKESPKEMAQLAGEIIMKGVGFLR